MRRVGRSVVSATTHTPASGPFGPVTTPPMSSPSMETGRGACALPTPPASAASIRATPTAANCRWNTLRVIGGLPQPAFARGFGAAGRIYCSCCSRERTITMAFDSRTTSFSTANAQILAQASAVAYDTPERCAKWAKMAGFTGAFDFFDKLDTQGCVAESGEAIVVAFRGTHPDRPMDWFVDFRATCDPWDHKDGGKVHSGFYNALRKVWGVTLANGEILPRRLVNRGSKTIW